MRFRPRPFERVGSGTLIAGVVLVAAAAGNAAAGGAKFPNSLDVAAPADAPNEILVSTTFGLIASEDAGQTWTWSCPGASGAASITPGPAPRHRLFARADTLYYSDDGACGWQRAGGLIAGVAFVDAIAFDPSHPDHVLASVTLDAGDGGYTFQVLSSSDGGTTFDAGLYTNDNLLDSLAIPAADSNTIYATVDRSWAGAPTLARSTDAGATWHTVDLSGAIGPGSIRILEVDASRSDRLFLRQASAAGQAFVVATGGGANAAATLSFAGGTLTAFVRAPTGRLFVAGLDGARSPLLYRSDDGGASFTPLPGPPHIRALAARNGILYAATDSTSDLFFEATSADDGATWQPGLTFDRVQAVTACVEAACQSTCQFWADQGAWPATVCTADVLPRDGATDAADAAVARDGGADGGRSGADGGRGGAAGTRDIGGASGGGAGGALAPRSGCGCALSPASGPALACLAWMMLFWPVFRRRR